MLQKLKPVHLFLICLIIAIVAGYIGYRLMKQKPADVPVVVPHAPQRTVTKPQPTTAQISADDSLKHLNEKYPLRP